MSEFYDPVNTHGQIVVHEDRLSNENIDRIVAAVTDEDIDRIAARVVDALRKETVRWECSRCGFKQQSLGV